MRIHYFYRNHKAGYSIGRVFDSVISQFPDKQKIEVPCHNCSPISMLRNFLYIFIYRNKRVINHITGDIHYVMPALMGCKSVLTIHDTSSYDCCTNRFKRAIIGFLWFTVPIKIATKVTCISKETCRSIKRFTKRNDIEVIYNPVDPSFKTYNSHFDSNYPHYLIIGTAWNKNINNTLKALDGIAGEVCIIGKMTEEQKIVADGLKTIKVSNKFDLSSEDMIEEYKRCDIILFCSIYEGFGMPIIEGQKTGRVIVTSDIEPHKEIAGNGALFVDPMDSDSIRGAILRLISEDGLYDKIVEKGLDNVKRFDVTKISNDYLRIYESL